MRRHEAAVARGPPAPPDALPAPAHAAALPPPAPEPAGPLKRVKRTSALLEQAMQRARPEEEVKQVPRGAGQVAEAEPRELQLAQAAAMHEKPDNVSMASASSAESGDAMVAA